MYINLIKVNDTLYTFEKNGFPYAVSNTEGTPDSIKEEFDIVNAWAIANPDLVGSPEAEEPELSLSERAAGVVMTKLTFVEIVDALTTSLSQVDPTVTPITFETIWGWCLENPEIMKLFVIANEINRSDPRLNEVVNMLAPQFTYLLDMIFVYQAEIMAEIELAKAENRPIDLSMYVPAEHVNNAPNNDELVIENI